jgi:hypothetical protein
METRSAERGTRNDRVPAAEPWNWIPIVFYMAVMAAVAWEIVYGG